MLFSDDFDQTKNGKNVYKRWTLEVVSTEVSSVSITVSNWLNVLAWHQPTNKNLDFVIFWINIWVFEQCPKLNKPDLKCIYVLDRRKYFNFKLIIKINKELKGKKQYSFWKHFSKIKASKAKNVLKITVRTSCQKVPDMWLDFSSANLSKTAIKAESTWPLYV